LDGLIVFHHLDGTFANGWKYEQGKIVTSIVEIAGEDMMIAYRAIPARYEISQPATRSDDYYGGELPTVVITADGGGSNYDYGGYGYGYGYNGNGNSDGGGSSGGGSSGGGGGGEGGYYQSIEVILISPGVITLMDPYDLSLMPSTGTVIHATFKIINTGTYIIQDGTSPYCNERAKKSGNWVIQATVLLSCGGGPILSNPIIVTVQYPDVNTIKNNSIVSAKMSEVWSQTKSAASSSGRMEKGFAIFANTSTMTFECGTVINGSIVSSCDAEGSVKISDSESIHSSPIAGGKYLVADFHTHTPLTYCPSSKARLVGPSDTDITTSGNTPGIVYDYNGSYISSPEFTGVGIIGGHNKNDPAHPYTCGPNMRPIN
jgi:hypothetical protein